MSEATVVQRRSAIGSVVQDYLELSKARIVFMVILTTLAGFLMASAGSVQPLLLIHTLLGTAFVAAGTNALNQWWERDLDRKMKRTCRRPLPDGRITPAAAFVFATSISIVGIAYLWVLCGALASILSFVTLTSYLFAYTPLKRITPHSLLIGAIPGAIPPMIGWAAVRGGLDAGAWILFAILFLWQLPHFLAIGWMYRDDYARAGFRVVSVADTDGRVSGMQAMVYTAALLLISVIPSFLGLAGGAYLAGAVVTGIAFVVASVAFASARNMRTARYLFFVSILYLPLIMSLLVINRR